MEHNTNQNSNYLALLNLTDDGTYTVTKIEIIGSDKFVYIEKKLKAYSLPYVSVSYAFQGYICSKSKSSYLPRFNGYLLDSTTT